MTLAFENPSHSTVKMDGSEILAPEDAYSETLECILQKYDVPLYTKHPGVPTEIPSMTRKDLASLFASLGFNVGVEIGVERGIYSEVLCQANASLKLFCVDPWEHYAEYKDFMPPEIFTQNYRHAKERLKGYNCELLREYSANAVQKFDDFSLDFVYVDGNHDFFYITQDLYLWERKVRPGGIVAGHDYRKMRESKVPLHVPYVLGAWTAAHRICPWFVCGAAYDSGERDRFRSWFWVKRLHTFKKGDIR